MNDLSSAILPIYLFQIFIMLSFTIDSILFYIKFIILAKTLEDFSVSLSLPFRFSAV